MQVLRAGLVQALGCTVAGVLVLALPALLHGAWRLALLQGIAAAICSRLLRQPAWWVPMHLLFAPALLAALWLHLPAGFYLGGFIVLLLLFWGTAKGNAPLYLSSPAVVDAIAQIVQREQAASFAELGAGIGSVAVPLARHLPQLRVEAWERAPLPWAILTWRGRRLNNVDVSRSSFWDGDLSIHDVVYAFLSPLPMARLGEKVRREMPPGSLFVSSSFPVPDWAPEDVQAVQDRRGTQLYCYRIAERKTS